MSEPPVYSSGIDGPVDTSPPQPIRLSDILNATQLVQAKQDDEKLLLESIGRLPSEDLRGTLIQWAQKGFPNAYTLHTIQISPPSTCSDGVTRTLIEYVSFLTGTTMDGLLTELRTRLPDVEISYAWTGSAILIVVSKVS